ncbi:MAG: tetratricopeptide repeat protein [Akkermansiaceae bacterium]|nr:tetratricopeptide repeat protein [Verrucomicrobiales bacterium]
MSSLLLALIGAALATNTPAAVSNIVVQSTGISVTAPNAIDPVEKEFKKLEEDDDAAHAEVDRWIQENLEFRAKGAGVSNAELNARILKRLGVVQKAYEDFIQRQPAHVGVRLAYASFLEGMGEEDAALVQLEKAREIDPKDPAVWNNLANHYGHSGHVTNAFDYYAKAIALNPNEPVYYHNFGTTVYLFRKDAREFYNIDEQQVFDKAMSLYSNAMRLDPTNFVMAADVAQSYYGIRPIRTNDALTSWTNALNVAGNDFEREGVYLHLGRWKTTFGRYAEARALINSVTNASLIDLKERLVRNLNERESGTNNVSTTNESDRLPESPGISPTKTNTTQKISPKE